MSRVNEIVDSALSSHYGVDAEKVLQRGGSVSEAKALVEDTILRTSSGRPARGTSFVDGLTEAERNSYSIARALRYLSAERNEHLSADLEVSVSRHISKIIGKKTSGLFVPTALRSGLDTKSGTTGAYTVATEVRDLIQLLRNKARVIQMGATFLTGLEGNVAYPAQISGSNGAVWVSQNPGSDVADTDATFAQRNMSPKILMASTSYSRQLLVQSSLDVENVVRNDLAKAHAVAIDAAAINGSGLSNQPVGILQTSGVGSVIGGTNGSMITYALMISLQDAVFGASGDVNDDMLGYLSSVDVRTKLSKTGVLDQAGAGVVVWSGDVAAGFRAKATKNCPNNLSKGTSAGVANAVIFGDWSSLIIGEWGVMELVVDPYRLKKQNATEVTSYLLADILVALPASFAVMKDALVA